MNIGSEPMWTWVPKLFMHGATAVSPVGHMKWMAWLFVVFVIAAVIGVDPLYKSAAPKCDSTDQNKPGPERDQVD